MSHAIRIGLTLLSLGVTACESPAQEPSRPTSLFDPRLTELRTASVAWDNRRPDRRPLDQVCLVPDLPTFLEAIAAWDRRYYFPILIEDGEYTPKFLQAYRPARIVRYRGKVAELRPAAVWPAALAAVGRAWTDKDGPGQAPSGGAPPPKDVGPPPPGLVVSEPDSPALAGAVALAAGRFQPLLKWSSPKHFFDNPSQDEAEAMANSLTNAVAAIRPKYADLGDDCDFLTLAGNYPYRYQSDVQPQPGPAAFDDLLGRGPKPSAPNRPRTRWAYAGRLLGGPVESVYRAMSALFLQPDAATLFNTYGGEPAFQAYGTGEAADTLKRSLKVAEQAGPANDLNQWHRTFDPRNGAGLLLLNTSGSPTMFNIPGGPANTGDVPATGPTMVHVIHSYSAANPLDPNTIAGRWLANGAYLYYGSTEEPFLQSFRTPRLVASLLTDGIPFAAAVRMVPIEYGFFGNPWRLTVLGDPLCRLEPARKRLTAAVAENPSADWPVYRRETAPANSTDPNARLAWAVKRYLVSFQADAPAKDGEPAIDTLAAIPRDKLSRELRGLRDAMLAEAAFQAGRPDQVIQRFEAIPPAERTPGVQRTVETARMVLFSKAISEDRWADALNQWWALLRSDSPAELRAMATDRIGRLANSHERAVQWADRLAALDGKVEPALAAGIEAERKRILDSPQYKEGGQK